MATVLEAFQRNTLRRAVQAECQVVTERDFLLVGTKTLDLSLEGMLVETEHEPTLGEPLILSLRIPGTRVWMDAEATVARIVRGRRTTDRARGVGLRFTRIDLTDKAILAQALVGFPPPVPARSVRKDYAASVRLIAEWATRGGPLREGLGARIGQLGLDLFGPQPTVARVTAT